MPPPIFSFCVVFGLYLWTTAFACGRVADDPWSPAPQTTTRMFIGTHQMPLKRARPFGGVVEDYSFSMNGPACGSFTLFSSSVPYYFVCHRAKSCL